MNSNIKIPKLCKVGFMERSDTYTKRLGYVIYHDGKIWRKETSWEGWRTKYEDESSLLEKRQKAFEKQVKSATEYHFAAVEAIKQGNANHWHKIIGAKTLQQHLKDSNLTSAKTFSYYEGNVSSNKSLEPIEFDNVPTEGFVLNKKAGGGRGWDARATVCRVFDPRGFEFEIQIPNLLYILENSNSMKGKGLEGKFVYGWDGKELVLIPEEAPEYKEMVAFTELQDLKISKKDLKPGYKYHCSDNKVRTYLGEFYEDSNYSKITKKLWFAEEETWFNTQSIGTIKKEVEEDPNFASLIEKLESNKKKHAFIGATLDLEEFSRERFLSMKLDYYGENVFLKVGKKLECHRLTKKDVWSGGWTGGRYVPEFYFKGETYTKLTEIFEKFKTQLWRVKR